MEQNKAVVNRLDRWLPSIWAGNEEQLRKGRLILISSLMVIFMCIANGGFYAWIGHWIAFGTCIFGIVSAITCITILRRSQNTVLAGHFFASCCYIFFAIFTLSSYGMETLIVVWLFMAPLCAVLMVGINAGKFWAVMTLALFSVLIYLDVQGVELPATFDRAYIPLVNFVAFAGHLLFSAFAIISNEQVKERTLLNLKATKKEMLEKKQALEDINENILRTNRDLEEKVQQRTRRLELSNKELDTFLYESSHALRRPVVRLLGLSNVLRIADNAAEQENFLKAIEVTTTGMDKMLTDLLEVSELNSMEVNMREIHLSAFLVHLSESMDARELELDCEVEGAKPIVADGFLLALALRKLLENAIQYRKDDQFRAKVNIRAMRNETGWRLTLRDEGKGIHPDAIKDVKKMFAKGTEHSKGSGLGLYIADKAIRRMGGSLELESELGAWTVFTVQLPH